MFCTTIRGAFSSSGSMVQRSFILGTPFLTTSGEVDMHVSILKARFHLPLNPSDDTKQEVLCHCKTPRGTLLVVIAEIEL